MCTAISLKSKDGYHLFGRNMDLEYHFNQSVVFIPRNFEILNRVTNETQCQGYAIMAMATIMEGHPMLADGFNEHGLAVAGLNFPGYASYNDEPKERCHNIPVYDFMLWILRNFKSVDNLKEKIETVRLIAKPFLPNVPLPTLHWIVYDNSGKSIVIENEKDSFKVFDNPIGILANAPSFDWHLTNLNQYAGLKSSSPFDTTWHEYELKVDGQGSGLRGLPGDSYPASRFVRAAYLKSHIAFNQHHDSTLSSFFHILDNLSFVDGTVITNEGHQDITQYSSCMSLDTKTYYYKTYTNNQLNAIYMDNENLDTNKIVLYPYNTSQTINKQN